MAKKLFYSMGEVSEMFDVNASLLRFWETKFDVLRPKKNKKGNRLFSSVDVENIKLIYHLVKERGMTLEGAARCLKQNKGTIARDTELLERLQRVRAMLEEVRTELKDGEQTSAAGGANEYDIAVQVVDTTANGSAVQVIEPGPRSVQPSSKPAVARQPRRKKEQEETDKELFAFYEQSLF